MKYSERRGRSVVVSVSLMPETVERLNRLAGFLGQSRSSVAERVLCTSLPLLDDPLLTAALPPREAENTSGSA